MPYRCTRASLLAAVLALTAAAEERSVPEEARMAITYDQLGASYEQAGRQNDAELYYSRSIAAWEKAYGPEHPGLARLLNNLASAELAGKQYGRAQRTAERSLRVLRGAPGVMPPEDEARALIHLGGATRGLGRREEAETAYLNAEEILSREATRDNEALAHLWNNLGALYADGKQTAKAMRSLERSLAIQGEGCSANKASTLANLAAAAGQARRPGDAEPAMRRAVECAEVALGADHPRTAEFLEGHASLLRELKRKQEAKQLEMRAAAIRERAGRPDQAVLVVDARELQAARRTRR